MSFARSNIIKFSSDRNIGGYMPQFTVPRLMTITEYTFYSYRISWFFLLHFIFNRNMILQKILVIIIWMYIHNITSILEYLHFSRFKWGGMNRHVLILVFNILFYFCLVNHMNVFFQFKMDNRPFLNINWYLYKDLFILPKINTR